MKIFLKFNKKNREQRKQIEFFFCLAVLNFILEFELYSQNFYIYLKNKTFKK